MDEAAQPGERAAAQRGGVVPAFPEAGVEDAHRRAADGELHVVPGRVRAVGVRDRPALRVALMAGVVAPAVAEVDAADERDVLLGAAGVAQHDELLVVRAAGAHPHVEQALAARLLDLLAEVAVLAFAELQAVQVGAPHQSLDGDAPCRGGREHVPDLGALAGEPFVRVAAPVGEQQQVARAQPPYRGQELGEVRGAVHQRPYEVAVGPRPAAGAAVVDPGRGVAAFVGGQQPVARVHGAVLRVGNSPWGSTPSGGVGPARTARGVPDAPEG